MEVWSIMSFSFDEKVVDCGSEAVELLELWKLEVCRERKLRRLKVQYLKKLTRKLH